MTSPPRGLELKFGKSKELMLWLNVRNTQHLYLYEGPYSLCWMVPGVSRMIVGGPLDWILVGPMTCFAAVGTNANKIWTTVL